MALTPRVLGPIARYGLVIALVLAGVGVAGLAGAVHAYATPTVDTVTEETNQQTVGASVATSAVVNDNSTLYEEGRRLRNMPVYFLAGTPNLTVHVKSTVPRDARVRVSQRLVLAMQAARDGEVFWQSRRVIVADTATVPAGDAVHWTNGTVNVTRLRAVISEKQSAVSGVGTFSAVVRLNASYETPQYAGELTAATPIVITDRAYWFQDALAASRTHSTTVTRRVVRPPDVTRVGLLAGVGLLSLAGAVAVFRTYRRVDPKALETRAARRRYEEWISNGEIPTKSEKEYVRTDSLEDLVDVAIDSNKRVIYDREFDAYGVVEGDLVYFYSTGDEDLTEWLDI